MLRVILSSRKWHTTLLASCLTSCCWKSSSLCRAEASPIIAGLLDGFGHEAIEEIIIENYPNDTQRIIRAIAHIRASALPPTASLNGFIESHVVRRETEILTRNTPPEVLRGLLKTACEVEHFAFAFACIDDMIQACMTLRPQKIEILGPSHNKDEAVRPRDRVVIGERFAPKIAKPAVDNRKAACHLCVLACAAVL